MLNHSLTVILESLL